MHSCVAIVVAMYSTLMLDNATVYCFLIHPKTIGTNIETIPRSWTMFNYITFLVCISKFSQQEIVAFLIHKTNMQENILVNVRFFF